MKHFWNWADAACWIRDETGPDERILRLDGAIAEESWFDDEVTPGVFKDELFAADGPVTIWINSPGGDCIAAAQIYNMLREYPGDITVKVDGIAASAASVIAMAGDKLCMSPTSLLMIHNPLTVAMGDSREMLKAVQLLDEVKESIVNAYVLKTHLSRDRIGQLMDDETWMNANKAKELGFCDEILYEQESGAQSTSFSFAQNPANAQLLNRLMSHLPPEATIPPAPDPTRIDATGYDSQLQKLKYI